MTYLFPKHFPYLYYHSKDFFMKTSNRKEKNRATPGKPMPQDEFVSLIKEAEEGEFMTVEEFKERFNKWRAERKKS